MTTTTVDQLKEELTTNLKELRDIAAKADDEKRDFDDTERSRAQELMGKANDLKDRIKKADGDSAVRKAIADLGDDLGLDTKSDGHGNRVTDSGLIVPDGKKSLGHLYTESAEYKALLATAPNGQFGQKQRVQSGLTGFKSLVTGVSDTSAGAVIDPQRLGVQVGIEAFERPLTLRDVVTTGTTQTDSVEYVRVTGTTNNAAPVPEAVTTLPAGQSGTTIAQAGVKPESALTLAKITTPVKTIAHWIPMTKRAASDAAQVRTLVDGFLQYGLEEELEDQMVSGDGTGENFEGLSNVSGVQAQAWDTNVLTTTRKARTKVRTVGRSIPNAYVLNPVDVETIDLQQDNEARFYFGGPGGVGTVVGQTLWGLPVIECEGVPVGTGYVGDWRKAILWDREQASIQVTDSHLDFFVRNLLAILAEMRAAFGVIQPNAFVEIDLAA